MIWKILRPIGTAIDALNPIKWAMSDEEKQYLIKQEKEFSAKNRADNIKKSIADTKSKTLNMNNLDDTKISISDKAKVWLSSWLYLDWDKWWLVNSKWELVKRFDQLSKADIDELNYMQKTWKALSPDWRDYKITVSDNVKNMDMNTTNTTNSMTQKPITKITYKETVNEVTNKVSPNDKKKLDTLKATLAKMPKTALTWALTKIKKHPVIASIAWIVWYGAIDSYLTWEDVDTDESKVDNEINSILDDWEPLTLGWSTVQEQNKLQWWPSWITSTSNNDKEDLSKKVNYMDREIGRTIWGWYIFTGKNWKTRTYNTLEEAQKDINDNLNMYYQDEYMKAVTSNDEAKLNDIIKRAKERGIDVERLQL